MDFEKTFTEKCNSLKQDNKRKILISKVPTEMKMIRGAGGRVVNAFAVAKDDLIDFLLSPYYANIIRKSEEHISDFRNIGIS